MQIWLITHFSSHLGTVVLAWLLRLCNENETKFEHDMSHLLLQDFLKDSLTLQALGKKCVAAIQKFAENLLAKENYVAHHRKLYITNSMDAQTTSPVESQNNIIHNYLGINSKMNADKTISLIAENSKRTYDEDQRKGIKSLNETNLSSRAPTRDFIHKKSQAIADQNFEAAKSYAYCQVSERTWWVWYFDHIEGGEFKSFPWSALPRYCRVRVVTLNEANKLQFLSCDCGYYHRIGSLCSHLYRIVGCMDLNMFHIRHFKMYDVYHNKESALGQVLVKSQVRKIFFNHTLSTVLIIYVHECYIGTTFPK